MASSNHTPQTSRKQGLTHSNLALVHGCPARALPIRPQMFQGKPSRRDWSAPRCQRSPLSAIRSLRHGLLCFALPLNTRPRIMDLSFSTEIARRDHNAPSRPLSPKPAELNRGSLCAPGAGPVNCSSACSCHLKIARHTPNSPCQCRAHPEEAGGPLEPRRAPESWSGQGFWELMKETGQKSTEIP